MKRAYPNKGPMLKRLRGTIKRIFLSLPKSYMNRRRNKKEVRRVHEQLDASGESAHRFLQAMQPTADSYDHYGRLRSCKAPSGRFEAVQDRDEHVEIGANATYFTGQLEGARLELESIWYLDENLRVLPCPMPGSRARIWSYEHQHPKDLGVASLDFQRDYPNTTARNVDQKGQKPSITQTLSRIKDVRSQSSLRGDQDQNHSQTAGPSRTSRCGTRVQKKRSPLPKPSLDYISRDHVLKQWIVSPLIDT